jgi:beta-galactosidase
MQVQVDGEDVSIWAESYRTTTASASFAYDDGPMAGEAAVVRNGSVLSVGALSPLLIARVLAQVVTEAGIPAVALDEGVRVSRRGDIEIWMNFNDDSVRTPGGQEIPPVSFLVG